jgi:predicted ferric reductase
LYALAIVGPLATARATNHHGHRSFTLELGSSLGIVALSLLALQLVLPARLRPLSRLGSDVAVRLHRRLADATIALVVAHVAVVVLAKPQRIHLLTVVGAPWRAQAAVGSAAALAMLYATSAARRRLGMRYASWRGLHTALAALAVILAILHTVGVNRYLSHGIGALVLASLTVAALGAIVVLRVLRPAALAARPYVIERVVVERERVTTLELRADGHDGRRFEPGQFAWLKLADSAFGLSEHPFSYSSSAAHPDRPWFTIKAYGGFSSDIAWAPPGTRLIVDGPHGSYRPRFGSRGTALIAGGIGITPCMSILRTAVDRGDRRTFVLIVCGRTLDEVLFREELDALRQPLSLVVVPVLTDAPDDWRGERGFIDSGVLERHLPPDLHHLEFFVCGTAQLVDGALRSLAEIGIPDEIIHAERFVDV